MNTEDVLQNGSVLTALLHKFKTVQDQESLFAVLSCLKDSNVYIPVHMLLKDNDITAFQKKSNERMKVSVKPVLLTGSNGEKLFPVFSSHSEIPESFETENDFLQVSFLNIMHMFHQNKDINQIIVNPYSDKVLLNDKLVAMIEDLNHPKENDDD